MTSHSTIATVDAGAHFDFEAAPDAIATSSRADHAAVWDACIDALLRIWNGRGEIPAPVPCNEAINTAIRVLKDMRRSNPTDTPISIVPAPEGGIILEWRNERHGDEFIWTVSVLNDGVLETVIYHNGVAIDVRTVEPTVAN
jgi:hypothetical protein